MGRIENDGVIAVGAGRIGDKTALVNGDLIVLGNKTFEFRTSGSATPPNVQLDVKASDALTAVEVKDKINANVPSVPVTAYIDPIDAKVFRIEADGEGDRGNIAFTSTMTGATNIIAASDDDTLSHGENALNKHAREGSYKVTALDVAAGSIAIPTGLQSPSKLQVDAWSAVGLQKSLTTLFTFDSEGRIKGDFDGATNPIEGDLINWSAS